MGDVSEARIQKLIKDDAKRADFSRHNLRTLETGGQLELWDVPTLTYVNVCKNKLESLPEQLAQIPSLEQLHAADNRITTMNRINEYSKLAVLNINQNLLGEFPRGVGGCPKLQLLDMSMNLITEIPTNLRFCSTLRALWLCDNRLVNLPDCLVELTNLETLGLRNNRVEMLPDNIGTMPKLRQIFIDDNCFRVLPTSLKNCKAINDGGEFTCVNNFFCPPVEEALLLSHMSQTFLPLQKLCESKRYEDFYTEFVKRPPPLEDGMKKAIERRDAARK